MRQAIVILGPSGAGKSVQSEYLVSRHAGWVRLSSGDLLRADPLVAQHLTSGELVPSSEVERVITQALADNDDAAMIVFDGFPRVLDQAIWLDQVLDNVQRQLVEVVRLDLPFELAQQRLTQRHRLDDRADISAVKWQEYQDKTLRALAFYKQKGIVITVNSAATIESVGQTIEKSLHV